MKVIGVTGGVGAGKSTVLNYIQESCNCRIIFSDQVANDIKLKGQSCYEPIVELLSDEILGEDGEIDKKKIELESPIKSLGTYTAVLKLYSEVKGELKVSVVEE